MRGRGNKSSRFSLSPIRHIRRKEEGRRQPPCLCIAFAPATEGEGVTTDRNASSRTGEIAFCAPPRSRCVRVYSVKRRGATPAPPAARPAECRIRRLKSMRGLQATQCRSRFRRMPARVPDGAQWWRAAQQLPPATWRGAAQRCTYCETALTSFVRGATRNA